MLTTMSFPIDENSLNSFYGRFSSDSESGTQYCLNTLQYRAISALRTNSAFVFFYFIWATLMHF